MRKIHYMYFSFNDLEITIGDYADYEYPITLINIDRFVWSALAGVYR